MYGTAPQTGRRPPCADACSPSESSHSQPWAVTPWASSAPRVARASGRRTARARRTDSQPLARRPPGRRRSVSPPALRARAPSERRLARRRRAGALNLPAHRTARAPSDRARVRRASPRSTAAHKGATRPRARRPSGARASDHPRARARTSAPTGRNAATLRAQSATLRPEPALAQAGQTGVAACAGRQRRVHLQPALLHCGAPPRRARPSHAHPRRVLR